jgi:hypothetical protein
VLPESREFWTRMGDTRNKRLFGSDKPPSVNLDGASFIYINAATLVGYANSRAR